MLAVFLPNKSDTRGILIKFVMRCQRRSSNLSKHGCELTCLCFSKFIRILLVCSAHPHPLAESSKVLLYSRFWRGKWSTPVDSCSVHVRGRASTCRYPYPTFGPGNNWLHRRIKIFVCLLLLSTNAFMPCVTFFYLWHFI